MHCVLSCVMIVCVACSAAAGPHARELAELYRQDQAERSGDWSRLGPDEVRAIGERDRQRRETVLRWVRGDECLTPADRYHAAMVLQHGDEPDHYLLAHVLATAAAYDGLAEARWLSAAALDRFLHAIDRPQWFDTQFGKASTATTWTMEPRADWLPDALRATYQVPPAVAAAQQLQQLNSR